MTLCAPKNKFKLPMPSVISFGKACVPDDASFFGFFISGMMFYPYWLIVFNWIVGMIDERRYFFFASWIILTAGFHYLNSLSAIVGIERPESYDPFLCGATQFAFPDPLFVTSISYTLVTAIGLFRDGHRFGLINGTIAYSTPALYAIATVYTGYLSASQAAANLVVAVVTAAFFIFVYQAVAAKV